MPVFATVNSFNAGELSPKLRGRLDVAQYSKGCSELVNFLVTPYGGAERRPGTEYLARANCAKGGRVRLVRFVFSSTVAYVCEFADRSIRFLRDGRLIQTESGPLTVASPYTAAELSDLQFVQSADVMTIVHPDHPVQELKRVSEDSFTLTAKEYQYPPMLDPNLDDDHTIAASGVEGSVTLEASKDTFTDGNVGGYFQLIHSRKENELSVDFEADGDSENLEVFGYWTFSTHGTWTGHLTIQRSYDGGKTWKDFRTYSSTKDANTSTSGEEEEENVLYRLHMSDYEASDSGTLKLCRCLLVNPDFTVTGVVRIDSVADARHAAGTVLRKLGGTDATSEWNEGAWSRRRGFPRSVAYYEERMMFGGTSHRPQTVWGSRTGDWDHFLLGDKDDDALDFTIAADTVNTILWICQHDSLIIGTMDSEWTLSASDQQSALTPSNFQVKRQSVYGSAGIPAQMAGDVILFVQRGGRKVREFVYQWEKDGYSSPDMTILAEHITKGGIAETGLQTLPDTILWCVLGNGSLAALTYERDQEVIGWHRHETAGKILSLCVIPDGDEDRIYWAVERENGVFLERMAKRSFDSIADAFYVDCGITVAGEAVEEIGGLTHLEGAEVRILADGAVQKNRTVEHGRIRLDRAAKVVQCGLEFSSRLAPMPLELETQNGQSLMRKKTVGELRLRVYNSVGGRARCGDDVFQRIVSRDAIGDTFDAPVLPKDEIVTLNMLSGWKNSLEIEIEQSDPLPFNLDSLVALYEVSE